MGPTATERLLQNLQEGFIYTIAIVARSDYVPSDLIDLTEIVIGKANRYSPVTHASKLWQPSATHWC